MIRLIQIFIILSLATIAHCQSIQIGRADVDSTRAGIVTAGYGFELKISLAEIERVNNVSFKLVYDNEDVIKFSEYAYGDFDNPDFVFVRRPSSGGNSLSVSAFTGQPLPQSDLDDPAVITLRFTVARNAVNGQEVNFTFENAFATSFSEETGGESIELSGMDFSFIIHSYVDIWPGDANADGTVDAEDQNTIGLYLGEGSLTQNMRAFKRPSPSTRFYPQQVLLWDRPEYTYADCDGDGDVTVEDGMVVFLNEGKVVGQSDAGIIGGQSDYPKDIILEDDIEHSTTTKNQSIKNSTESFPVAISSPWQWKSIVMRVNTGDAEISDLRPSTMFGEGFSYLVHQKDGYAELLLGEFDIVGDIQRDLEGKLVDIIVEGNAELEIESIIGMDESGIKFPISLLSSSVDSDESSLESFIKYLNAHQTVNYHIYNMQGKLLITGSGVEISDTLENLYGLYIISTDRRVFKIAL